MVSEQVVTGGVAIVAAAVSYAVAGWINLKGTREQVSAQQEQLETRIAAENQQRRAGHFLERKVDELMHVYSVMEEARRLFKRRADATHYEGITEEEYDELVDKFDAYESAMDRACVFLEEEQQEKLKDVFNILMDALGPLYTSINNPDRVEPYQFGKHGLREYNDRFNTAEEMLQEEVKGPIDVIERDASVADED